MQTNFFDIGEQVAVSLNDNFIYARLATVNTFFTKGVGNGDYTDFVKCKLLDDDSEIEIPSVFIHKISEVVQMLESDLYALRSLKSVNQTPFKEETDRIISHLEFTLQNLTGVDHNDDCIE